MQLLMVVVQADDADVLTSRLVEQGLRVTRIDSVGSFLMRGNVTILLGLQDEQVEVALETIRATCRVRTTHISALPVAEVPGLSFVVTMPLEAQVGGAVVFSIPVKRFYRLMGGMAPATADLRHPLSDHAGDGGAATTGGGAMDLVVAIVQNEDSGSAVGGLVAAGYQVTRLNTAGGFLRRSNATLLVGVESDRVDDVVDIIQERCQLRADVHPPEAGMPAHSATVFVLEASRFARI